MDTKAMKSFIEHYREKWPTLAGNGDMNVLDHLLVCNGTGFHWSDDGKTVVYTLEPYPGEQKESRAEIHAGAFAKLRTMPDFKPVTKHHSIGKHGMDGYRYALVDKEQEKALEEWDLDHVTREAATARVLADIDDLKRGRDGTIPPNDYTHQMYLERVCAPPSFYTLSLERYSNVAIMTSKADDETVQACFRVLFDGVLTHPQGEGHHQQSNHINALILLMRHKRIFQDRGVWPGDDVIIEHRANVGKERLRCSCKEHVSNHVIDEDQLTDEEYFWYRGLSLDGLTPEEIKLVRKYSFYLRWKKGMELQQKSDYSSTDFNRKREFWKLLKFTRNKDKMHIPEQTIDNPEAVAHAYGNRMIFKS